MPEGDSLPPGAYTALLDEAAAVAAKAVERIHALSDRYPGGVPTPQLEQLKRAHADPGAERRGGVRLPGGPEEVLVQAGSEVPSTAVLVDLAPCGLSLRLPTLALPGVVLRVRLPGREDWCPVQVRHCHPAGDAWLAGCAFAAGPPTG
jgi:hypothetical protein